MQRIADPRFTLRLVSAEPPREKLNLRLSENFYTPIKKLKIKKTQVPAVGDLSLEKWLVAVDYKEPHAFDFIFDKLRPKQQGYTRFSIDVALKRIVLWFKKGINPTYLAGIQLVSDTNELIFESAGLN